MNESDWPIVLSYSDRVMHKAWGTICPMDTRAHAPISLNCSKTDENERYSSQVSQVR